jgi:hypothetical protein
MFLQCCKIRSASHLGIVRPTASLKELDTNIEQSRLGVWEELLFDMRQISDYSIFFTAVKSTRKIQYAQNANNNYPSEFQHQAAPSNRAFNNSSMCARCALTFPSSCSFSNTASTSKGGLSLNLCARFQRLMRGIPMHGYFGVSTSFTQRAGSRHSRQIENLCQSHGTLSRTVADLLDAPWEISFPPLLLSSTFLCVPRSS